MTKATAVHIAVLLLCSSIAAAQNVPAQGAPEAGSEEIQKVVIVSTGSRGSQRTVVDTPVPIDILSTRDLNKSGQVSLDKALGFRVPSFNTVQTPVNDATSLLDPYEIRNMGPSRSLILINGKRKNSSALVYVNTSPGRGESGSDISAIPADAIKRIEVLRDGASAQYGSDAISGVVNIILKDSARDGSLTVRAGETSKRDGKMGGISLNQGLSLGGKGFFNYTLDASKVGLSNRPGMVSARGEAGDFRPQGVDVNTFLPEVQAFLAVHPDAGNINGSPETKATKFLVNMGYDLSDDLRVYGNAAYIKKTVDSNANYRTPYWRTTDFGLLHAAGTPYMGYMPTFIGDLDDYNGTFGTKFTVAGWASDVSLTTGGNKQIYNIGNSLNRSLGAASPTQFYAGGAEFKHNVFNADFSKQLTDTVNGYFGTEARWEEFTTIAGVPASYENGGSDSFAGNDIKNSGTKRRHNYGVYGGAAVDISKEWMIDGTGRFEDYSDFGHAFVWKLATRYKVSDQVTLRGSASTGFRAPSLHQLFTQKTQYSFVAGKGIQVSGLANNDSAAVRKLGVDQLQPEKSKNFTLGLGWKGDANTSATLDYYNIAVKNRITLSKEIHATGDINNPVDKALNIDPTNPIVSLSFFTNAVDTRTSGLDYVLSKKNLDLLDGKLTLNLSGNYSLDNKRNGDVHTPAVIAATGQSVFDNTQEALMFTSRPKYKTILGLDLDYSKFNFSLNNTMFGPTRFHQAGIDDNLDTEFKTKVLTDFAVNYQVRPDITFAFNINNIFNVTPKWEFKPLNAAGSALLASSALDPVYGLTPREMQTNLITFNGRYSMVTYDGSHFSQLGRTFAASLNYRF